MFFPTDSGNFCYSNDLFDFSQGIPGTQFHLYRKFAWKPIQKYLSELAFPALMEKKERATFYYLSALGLYFDDLEKTAQFARWAYENPKNEMRRDWPGMCCPFQIACLQWRYQNRLAFTRCRNLDFKSAELDSETRTLEAELSAEPDSLLELHSEIPPKSAARNGQSISLPESGRHTYLIPLIPGENRLTISF